MPQERGPALRFGTGEIRDRFVILIPRAARLRCLGKAIQGCTQGLSFLDQDPVSGEHQIGQREPGRRSDGHPSMIAETWQYLNTPFRH